ncbi:BREX-1 system adenine-specific DNA-methyltransferase PglX [Castellaniella caeni]|uniref:BREX-1 system adenine-specific DNA-methyltransferase PglX n=1 Tax=Castellaniella caeni TaxID=266123 RepID=UPI000A07BA44|nr:BREX-1 system adenine-specific DNA-methyltransferase PglX [Castellaniella caeni]
MSEIQYNTHEQDIERHFFRASTSDFKKILGSPIAYWASDAVVKIFANGKPLGSLGKIGKGSDTGKNELFIRAWPEISFNKLDIYCHSTQDTFNNHKKYYPTHRGGGFRKWFGNQSDVINWQNDGKAIRDCPGSTTRNHKYYFNPCISWGKITSSKLSVRNIPQGSISDDAGPSAFLGNLNQSTLGFLNSSLAERLVSFLSPTLNFQVGDISALPILEYCENIGEEHGAIISTLISISRNDWDTHENSWDFTDSPLLSNDHRRFTLEATYHFVRTHWRKITLEMQRLEEENNRIFIDAYGLKDELSPEVPLDEITLTCNPHYRYSGNKTEDELEALLLADTMREFISYAVGCMLGRYSLDKPGLILANQGEPLADYLKQVPQPSFTPDKDNVIPMLDGDWFADDIVERFRQFLRITFGEEHYKENLQFIEQALNVKGKRNYTLRDYFLGEFYTDHVKRYKKRPIYWLFSSPKGSFNALIYMHRYRPDTVSVVLNDYLREFRAKLDAHLQHLKATSISAGSSQGEKTKALKEIDKVTKVMAELEDYERDVLYPLATQQIEIDLDDGVKANYPRFGAALKKIPGLDAEDDD